MIGRFARRPRPTSSFSLISDHVFDGVKHTGSLATNGNLSLFSPAAAPNSGLYDASGRQTVASKIEKRRREKKERA